MKRICFLLLFWFSNHTYLQAQGSSFNINYTGFSPAAQTAFDYAAQLWTYKLNSTVPIKVNAIYFTIPGGPLAITFSNGRKDFAGAPMDSTWYPTTLANAISSTELNTGEYDMDIIVNGGMSWYFGTDGLTPAGQYDFVSVALHEIGHALGFTSLAKKDTTTGSIGLLEMSDFSPVVTSFPWPDLDTLPGIFDRFVENNGGTDLLVHPNPSTTLGTQLTSNQLYFNGPFTLAATGGTRARLYAPGTFALGSSVLHLNEATYPHGHADELMTPFITAGKSNHNVGPMTLGMLHDMGWSLYVGMNEVNPGDPSWQLWPNPANSHTFISQLPEGKKQINLADASGRTVNSFTTNLTQTELTLNNLRPGVYFVQVLGVTGTSTRKMVITE